MQLAHGGILEHMHQLLVLGHAVIDLVEQVLRRLGLFVLDVLLKFRNQAVALGALLAHELIDTRLELEVLVGRMRGRSRNDERRAGLVDQDAIDLVDDREVVAALHLVLGVKGHAVVAQVVESEFAVGAIRYITAVLLAALIRRHLVLNATHTQAEILEDEPHPLRVTAGQVVVDRDQVDPLAGQGIQIDRHRRDEGLALARRHLGYLRFVKDDTADQLHIKRNHIPGQLVADDRLRGPHQAATGVLDHGIGFVQEIIHRLAILDAGPEFVRFGL